MSEDEAGLNAGELTEREKVALFIGKNADRYLRIYDAMLAFEAEQQADKGRAFRIGDIDFFSLPIVLVAPLWLVYRKFFGWAAGWFAVVFVWDLVTMNLMPQGIISNIAFYGVLVGASVWAALSFPIRYVNHARQQTTSLDEYALQKTGGTSWLAVIAALVLLYALEAGLAVLIPQA